MNSILKTSVIKSPSKNIARWMIACVPNVKSNSALVLKGTYPSYLFEIVPSSRTTIDAIRVEYLTTTFHIIVRLDIDKAGVPPNSYLVEMLQWYGQSKVKPALSKINAAV